MKLSKFTVIMAVLLMAILAIGAVSAESIDDTDVSIAAGDSDLDLQLIDDSAEDLSAAETIDDVVSTDDDVEIIGDTILTDGDEGGDEGDANVYQINDGTYSTYFNDDGTPKDTLSPMGNYTLVIDTLTDKNIVISSGSNINITGKESEVDGETSYGCIDGTITIGDYAGSAGSIIISNLEINALNAAAINILDFTTDVTIKDCRISAIGDTEQNADPRLSVYGINANGFISGLYILDNEFKISGDAPYSYGIQVGSYGAYANPEDIVIAGNEIDVIVEDCMAEAIYLDNPVNVLVENNTVTVQNTGNSCAYGIQIADSAQYVFYEAGYEGTLTSGHDILIQNNDFDIASDFMIYGITVLDFGADGYDPDMATYGFSMPLCYQFDLNTTIVDNTVVAKSKKGVIGIGGQTYNMTVMNNDVTAIGTSAVDMETGDALGNHTSALCVQYNAGTAEDDYYVIVKDNQVTTNVLAEEINAQSYLAYVTFENNTATPAFYIDDESYSTYFNDDGTPKSTLPEDGGYVLYIDVIHSCDIVIDSGSDITITALTDYRDAEDGEGIVGNIIDGTIFIKTSGVTISGLRITNLNIVGIDIADGSNDITIEDNTIDITSVPVEGDSYFSVYAINANGFISCLYINDNDISVSGSAPYNYGINLGSYGASSNPDDIQIVGNNIEMIVKGENAIMAEPIYLDNPINALVYANTIDVTTEGNVFAYGIQIADSAQYVYYYAGYEGSLTSPANVTIAHNEITLDSEYMIYGITFQSFGANGYDEEWIELEFYMPACYQFEQNTTITNNVITARSDRGVIGIGALAYNVTIQDNTLYIYGTSAEGIQSQDAFGNDTYALGVNYNAAGADDDYYSIVVDNYVKTDVTGEHINAQSYLEYVTFENNVIIKMKGDAYVIDDSNYDMYFDENGKLLEDSPIGGGFEVVLLGNLTNKKMVFDVTVSISALDEESKLVNSTISLIEGADHSYINGLTMVFDNNTASTAMIYVSNVDYVDITQNTIVASDCKAMMMAIEIESGSEGCSEIVISENIIAVAGDTNYLYGIDVFQTWQSEAQNTNIDIEDNDVIVLGGAKMAEPIYVSAAGNVEIRGNNLTAVSNGCAYGIATDSLHDAEITENIINIEAATKGMAYGITSTNSHDIEITDNQINAEGRGVVAIGLKDDETVSISGNSGTLTGAYFESAETRDSIGKANAAILNKDDSSTDVTIGENNFVENFPTEFVLIDDSNYDQYFDENGNIKENAIGENAYVMLGNMIGKKMVIDIPVVITKQDDTQLVNSTISLIEGADGTTIDGLTIVFDNNTASTGVIYITNVNDVTITKNTIVASDCNAMMMAIEVESGSEGCSNITISENTIAVAGTTNYLYGIDVFQTWQSEAKNENIDIVDNSVTVLGGGRMAEPIYVSAAENVLIKGNELTSITNASAYGIATDSLSNAQITDNVINAESVGNGMVYALTSTNSNGVEIADNEITAKGTGAVGIGLNADDGVTIEDNTISIDGGDFTTAETRDSLGTANAAILNKDDSSTDVTIGENTITVNGPKLIDDSTYDQYFYENGTIKDDAPIAMGDTLLIGNLTNKKMIFDVYVDIKGLEDNKLVNTTINLVAGADGTSIDGLNMEFTGDETTGSIGLIYAKDVSDISITNNNIAVPEFVDQTGAKWGSSIYAIEIESGSGGCSFVTITGNNIEINGSARYLYGIDVFKTWGEGNERNSLINIANNNVTLLGGSRMAEAIYVSESDDISVTNNTISSTSTGAAYGIATDQLVGSEIKDNTIVAASLGNMAYGITSTTTGSDIVIEGNNVTSIGVGAVGVGLSGQDNVTINGNNIEITGGDFTTITTVDNLGTANAAILNKDESTTNLAVGENALTENGKATDRIITGNGTKDLQNILDAAEAGSTVDLTDQYFNNVGTVVIDKDIAITGGKIIGAEGKAIFEIAPKSANGPSEVNITGVNILVNNANTIVKVTAENATGGTSIEVPAINIKDNVIEAANDDVVTESVTVLEIDSERPILSPTNDVSISGNEIAAGVDPFDFKVTSISSGGDTIITPQNISTEKKATIIVYSDMSTTAVDMALDGRVGEWFKFKLTDADGNPLANMPMEIGFNGKIYNYENDGIITDENGTAQLQINLGSIGSNTFAISFIGNDEYNASFAVARINVTAQKGSMTVPNKSYKASAKTKALTATLKSASGKAIKNKVITFDINGKTYTAKTNAKGVATVKVSISKKGTYKYTVKFANDVRYAAITKTAKLTVK